MREIAEELNTPLIDMTKKSMALVEDWGVQKSQLLYHHLESGEHPNYPDGREDNTHFSELGARKMAQLVLDGMEEIDLDLVNQVVVGKR